MNDRKKVILISSEKTLFDNGKYYCDNKDIKSIPEALMKYFELLLIVRITKIARILGSHEIKLNKIIGGSNILKFISIILKTFKEKNTNYLLISISPYTFIAYLFLFFFKKKIFVYLRSDGYEEYRCKSRFFGPII